MSKYNIVASTTPPPQPCIVARGNIQLGELITEEEPLRHLEPDIECKSFNDDWWFPHQRTHAPEIKILTAYTNLSAGKQRQVDALLGNPQYGQTVANVIDRGLANCFDEEKQVGKKTSLLKDISRINHSCQPNAVTG
jgi:hypothetical protein